MIEVDAERDSPGFYRVKPRTPRVSLERTSVTLEMRDIAQRLALLPAAPHGARRIAER